MAITKGMLQERLELYKEQQQQLVKQVSAYDGAIQDCEFWLAELNAPEEDSDGDDSSLSD